MEDQLEDDAGGVSWSVHLSQTADISVTTAASFIFLDGNVITFSPTADTPAGVYTYTVKQSSRDDPDCIDIEVTHTITVPDLPSKTMAASLAADVQVFVVAAAVASVALVNMPMSSGGADRAPSSRRNNASSTKSAESTKTTKSASAAKASKTDL